MEKEKTIKVENVSHRYNSGISAIEGIDITIKKGEFICLLGPSGCGKSTLLNIVAGFIKPSEGAVFVGDRKIEKPDWSRGVVFQNPVLYPWLSVRENIAFGLKRRRKQKPEIEETVNEYIRMVGLEEFSNNKVYELSGGMQQRASLARVLVNYPEIVLMDEPFGALDALTRMNMQTMVKKIWKETGNTFLMITHDVDEALRLGTRILVMSERPGKIIKTVIPDFDAERVCVDNELIIRYNELKEEILGVVNPNGQKL